MVIFTSEDVELAPLMIEDRKTGKIFAGMDAIILVVVLSALYMLRYSLLPIIVAGCPEASLRQLYRVRQLGFPVHVRTYPARADLVQ
jgi:hypothetical protein